MTNKITQKSGQNSNNITVLGDLHTGISKSDAKEIAIEVFRTELDKLTGAAFEEASNKIEEFAEELTNRISNDLSEFSAFSRPDVQFAIHEAQKSYAEIGDPDGKNLSIEVLMKLISRSPKTDSSFVIREAAKIAPKIPGSAAALLSLLFFTRAVTLEIDLTKLSPPEGLERLINHVKLHINTFIEEAKNSRLHIQILQTLGCVYKTIGTYDFESYFTNQAKKLSRRYSLDELTENKYFGLPVQLFLEIPAFSGSYYFIPKDYGFSKTNQLYSNPAYKYNFLKIEETDRKALENENLYIDSKYIESIISRDSELLNAKSFFDDVVIKNFNVTPVGFAIAIANFKMKGIEFDDNIWIPKT
jgi:hypothetical protein